MNTDRIAARQHPTSTGNDMPDQAANRSLAYVMFTSGSTGAPKAVAVEHRSVVRLVCNTNYITIADSDVFLFLAPLAFDLSTLEVWAPLLHGATLVLYPPEPVDLVTLRDVLISNRVSVLWLTAGLFHRVVEDRLDAFGTLRLLLSGGDVVSPTSVAKVLQKYPQLEVVDGYGPTEGTTFSTFCRIGPDDCKARTLPIGRPISNSRVYIVDSNSDLAPIGMTGEICIAGDGLARCYYNDEDLTAQKFIRSPKMPGERLYRTGDKGRYLEDGRIEFLGRMDRQLKLRGYRVEPIEIEDALRKCPGIKNAVVVAPENSRTGEKSLIAYVVGASSDGHRLDIENTRAALGEYLPRFMIPSEIIQVDDIPLTTNGKVDYPSLIAFERRTQALTSVAPRTRTEEQIARAFSELLGVASVNANDSFYDLGGSSLSIMRLTAKIRSHFGIEVSTALIGEQPTVEAIASHIDTVLASRGSRDLPYRCVDPDEWGVVSYAQLRMLRNYQVNRPSHSFAVILKVTGDLDVESLRRALDAIVRRHSVLRAVFFQRNGVWRQRVTHPPECALEYVDLTLPHLGMTAERTLRCEEITAELVNRGFTIESDRLYRFVAVRTGQREHRLVFVFNHLVSDGISVGVFAGELAAGYSQHQDAAAVPELPYQYMDYAHWQRRRYDKAKEQEMVGQWIGKLAKLPPPLRLSMSVDCSQAYDSAGYWGFSLPDSLMSQLSSLSESTGTPVPTILLAAYAMALSRLTGQTDVVIATVLAERELAELEAMIGLFINWTITRTDLSGASTLANALARVAEALKATSSLSTCPFVLVEDMVASQQGWSRGGIYNAAFNYVPYEFGRFTLDGLEVERLPYRSGSTRTDLILDLQRCGEQCHGTLVYRKAVCPESEAQRLVAAFAESLERMVRECGRPVALRHTGGRRAQ